MSVIYLLPLGDARQEYVSELKEPLRETFRAETAILDPVTDMQSFYDEQRNQYNSTSIIRYIKENFTNSYLLTKRHSHTKTFLGITANDLYIPILTYVFGEAELNGGVGVASYFRLRNEIYGLPANRPQLLDRLRKEAIHELGHAFGLVHCLTPVCVMHSSTYVEDIDLKGREFCPDCNGILHAPPAA